MIGYHLHGNGNNKVLVLHGWLGDSTAFDPVIPFLDTQTFTYAFMDYRGYGQSASLSGSYTIAEIISDALELVDALGWHQFSVIGHSMGGKVVQWLAAQVPLRVQKICGIAPVPAGGFPMDEATTALFRGATHMPENRFAILMHTTGNRLSSKFGEVMTERSLTQSTSQAFDGYLTAWSAIMPIEEMMGLQVPFQILVGEHDPAVTAELAKSTMLQWFPNSQLTIIPNAGHYPMIEAPVNLVTLLEAFLSSKAIVSVK
jgi:pimeloyl-ACP methyl ester carboxylesterase